MFKVGDRVQVAAENYGKGNYSAGQIGVVEEIRGRESCGPGGIGAYIRFPHGEFYLYGWEMTEPDEPTAPPRGRAKRA